MDSGLLMDLVVTTKFLYHQEPTDSINNGVGLALIAGHNAAGGKETKTSYFSKQKILSSKIILAHQLPNLWEEAYSQRLVYL